MKAPRSTDRTFEAQLRGMLLDGLAPCAPPRRDALRERVLRGATKPAVEPVIVRADVGEWRPFIPGVKLKLLRLDRAARTQTSLWRLEAGAALPPHDHRGEEECLILEGSVLYERREYVAGDYLLAPPGLHHPEFVSPRGALLLIRGELSGPLEGLFADCR